MTTPMNLDPGTRAAIDQQLADVSAAVDTMLAAVPPPSPDRIFQLGALADRIAMTARDLLIRHDETDLLGAVVTIGAELARRLVEADRG